MQESKKLSLSSFYILFQIRTRGSSLFNKVIFSVQQIVSYYYSKTINFVLVFENYFFIFADKFWILW